MVEEKNKKTLGGRLKEPPRPAAEPAPPAPAQGSSHRLDPTIVREVTKNFGGRPRKHEPEVGDKISFSVRLAAELKEQLDKAAEQAGRSLSQETELRLARSFERQQLLKEVLELSFGQHIAGLLVLMGVTMAAAVRASGHEPTIDTHWPADARARLATHNVARLMLDLQPLPETAENDAANVLGEAAGIADMVVEAQLNALKRLSAPTLDNSKKTYNALAAAVIESIGPFLDEMIAEMAIFRKQGGPREWRSGTTPHPYQRANLPYDAAVVDNMLKAYIRRLKKRK